MIRYFARLSPEMKLYGTNTFESSEIDQWLEFTKSEVEPMANLVLQNILGKLHNNQQTFKKAVNNLMRRLQIVNDHLTTHTFFLGNRVTLADISFVTALVPLFRLYFDENNRRRIPCVYRLVNFLTHQPHFLSVLGRVWICE